MTVEIPATATATTHYAIMVYPPKKKPPFDMPTPVSLCPGARTTSDPLASRWQAVTCRQCIAYRKALGL